MTPSGAAKSEAEPRLLLAFVTRQSELQERDDVSKEFPRRWVTENVLANGLIAACQVAHLGYVERVLHEPHVKDEVRCRREPVLVAEARDVHEHGGLPRSVEGVERLAKIPHRKMRRVDDLVCALAEVDEHSALLVDGGLDASRRIDRMAMAGLAVPT